jgi:hypothetical protein
VRRAAQPRPRSRSRTQAGALTAGLLLAASLLASCSSARSDLGTTDESCYLTLPTAARAVGGHGHLEGVRKFNFSDLRGMAPRLYGQLAHDDLTPKQAVCLAAYTGHFTASEVAKPLEHRSGTSAVAVAVVTTPANRLLGTLILTKLPVRFEHTHPF